MLNRSERLKVLKTWRDFAFLGQLPVEVDLKNWRLNVPIVKKQWICAVSYILYVLHSLFKTSSLLYACFFVPDIQLHQLVVHAAVALASVMSAFWYFVAYIQDPELFAKYAKLTLVGNVGGAPDMKDGWKQHWTRRLREYSMQDFIGMYALHFAKLVVPVITVTYVYDPTMRLLLYNALPPYLQNWATFGLLLVEEVRYLTINIVVATPIWQLHVMSFELVINRLLALTHKIQTGTVTRVTTHRTLRSLQLYVSMFNEVNSYLIFTWKLLSITGAILGGFAAIAHFREYPLFGIMYYVILMDCVFLYAFIYEKAFMIPRLFEETAACALLHIRGNSVWKDIYRRHISSIPRAAIVVGNFHKMERTSTMIFINFVVTNIVSMLVAFG